MACSLANQIAEILSIPFIGLLNAEGSAGTKSSSSAVSIIDGWAIW